LHLKGPRFLGRSRRDAADLEQRNSALRLLYGVISYTVAQRSGIVGLILREVAVLIGIGIAIGAGLALGGGKAASSLLYGLKANDPFTFALAVILLAAIGLAAIFVPARRASRLDPTVALRYE